jgi:hypothetical protein
VVRLLSYSWFDGFDVSDIVKDNQNDHLVGFLAFFCV